MTFAPWQAAGEGIYFLPQLSMLYRVKLSSVVVDAPSKQAAYGAALARLRATPEAFIVGVYDDETDHSRTPLWKRLVTGK